MSELDLGRAMTITQEAFNKSLELQASPLSVAVLDVGGKVISLQRQDGSSMLRPDIAFAKAWGAVAMGKSSRAIGIDAQERPAFVSALNTLAQGNVIPVAGGVLIRNDENVVVGAVGISGDTSDIDELCAITGVLAAGFFVETAS
ncbi:GlcG/HbpS family heme-binding protein [Neptunomonas antarctica]|uniref:Uncharacterized conserved protein GlcG, DUF336 family n=1 Tax=Neptunomonas antarctica TaxID=619304 RepID=A0A1N7L9P5_9GAMM|nr:heme-binding protein [Neptunomonas antarctica]SIS70595.1 Uncharacterized conserved protein GlcG, DUF336 family [Neptunomonas antarctica]